MMNGYDYVYDPIFVFGSKSLYFYVDSADLDVHLSLLGRSDGGIPICQVVFCRFAANGPNSFDTNIKN